MLSTRLQQVWVEKARGDVERGKLVNKVNMVTKLMEDWREKYWKAVSNSDARHHRELEERENYWKAKVERVRVETGKELPSSYQVIMTNGREGAYREGYREGYVDAKVGEPPTIPLDFLDEPAGLGGIVGSSLLEDGPMVAKGSAHSVGPAHVREGRAVSAPLRPSALAPPFSQRSFCFFDSLDGRC